MIINDPIADTLSRIRNAIMRSYKDVVVVKSRISDSILSILKENNYIKDYETVDGDSVQKKIKVTLNYDEEGKSAIQKLIRVSKPGLRKYVKYTSIPKVLSGFGISIISTSRGIMTGKQAKEQRIGGEILCKVY